jgi:hypothetical protein
MGNVTTFSCYVVPHRQAQGKASFCEQKEAKNFFAPGHACFGATGSSEQKFLRRFFSKSGRFLF